MTTVLIFVYMIAFSNINTIIFCKCLTNDEPNGIIRLCTELTARTYVESFLYERRRIMQLATKEFLAEIDRMAEERKNAIRSSKSEYPTTGTVYYVSAEGNDENDGKSAERPIKTLE